MFKSLKGDTVWQKILSAKLGKAKSIIISEAELLNDKNVNAICKLIEEHRLEYFEVNNSISESVVERLISAAKDSSSKIKAKIQCVRFENNPLIDLEKLLYDYPNIECRVNIFNAKLKKVDVKIINPSACRLPEDTLIFKDKQPLSFVPSDTDEYTSTDSDDELPALISSGDELPACANSCSADTLKMDELKTLGVSSWNLNNVDPKL